MEAGRYLMVLPVQNFRISTDEVAIESAFREHLRMLLQSMPSSVQGMTILSPEMTSAEFEERSRYLARVSEVEDDIRVVPLEPGGTGPIGFYLRHFIPCLIRTWHAVGDAAVVHSGPSHVYRLSEFVAIVAGVLRSRPTVFVVDVDQRERANLNRATGRWSTRSYLLAKYLYDPIFSLQIRFASRYCSLVMLKGRGLVEHYGKGRGHVKNLLDPAHSSEQLIGNEEHQAKVNRLRDESKPLVLTYFGRLTAYKGIDRCIEILKVLEQRCPGRFSLVIIGAGEQESDLQALTKDLGLSECVTFLGALPFGSELFGAIRACDVALATPLAPDAPRSSLDAMCSGLPLLAFDIDYYRSLGQDSNAVRVVTWDDVHSAADALIELESDRPELVKMSYAAVEFARENTQDRWLQKRAEWTVKYCALAGD